MFSSVWNTEKINHRAHRQAHPLHLKLQEVEHKPTHLSASISRGLLPWAQPFTIQAASKAARKPRAQPVPIGQKGFKHKTWCQGEHTQARVSKNSDNTQHRLLSLLHLTSSRLSPTSATTNWCPCFSLIRAAFSEAYMLVKSNMATSGWP